MANLSEKLALIFAVAENGAIGRAGGLPWHFPEDREHFLRTTRGHVVIMGRRTWEERGEPLPECTNIMVSTTLASAPSGVFVVPALDDALAIARKIDEEPFVIGGVKLFEEALPRATRIYVTDVAGTPEADTFFRLDRSQFRVVEERVSPPSLRFSVLEPKAATSS